jgi:hypothetical protein
MSASASNVPAVDSTRVAARPAWVRPARSAGAFWMPSLLVLGGLLLLLALWPHRLRRSVPRAQPAAMARHMLPEAAASYVLLKGSYPVRDPLRNHWVSSADGAALPESDAAAAPRLPAAEYTGLSAAAAWTPLLIGVPAPPPPSLAERAVPGVFGAIAPQTHAPHVRLSPGLEKAAFRFDLPAGLATNTPATAHFDLELDEKGDVMLLLVEPCDNPAAARLLEAAISRGYGSGTAAGRVTVSWGN